MFGYWGSVVQVMSGDDGGTHSAGATPNAAVVAAGATAKKGKGNPPPLWGETWSSERLKMLKMELTLWQDQSGLDNDQQVAAFVQAQCEGMRRQKLLKWYIKFKEDNNGKIPFVKDLVKYATSQEPDMEYLTFDAFVRFVDVKQTSNESMLDFIDRFAIAASDLESKGTTFPDVLKAMLLLNRANVDIHVKRMALQAAQDPSTKAITTDLVASELRRIFHTSSSSSKHAAGGEGEGAGADSERAISTKEMEAFLAKRGLKLSPKTKKKNDGRKDVACYYCQEKGHIKPNCPRKARGEPPVKKEEGSGQGAEGEGADGGVAELVADDPEVNWDAYSSNFFGFVAEMVHDPEVLRRSESDHSTPVDSEQTPTARRWRFHEAFEPELEAWLARNLVEEVADSAVSAGLLPDPLALPGSFLDSFGRLRVAPFVPEVDPVQGQGATGDADEDDTVETSSEESIFIDPMEEADEEDLELLERSALVEDQMFAERQATIFSDNVPQHAGVCRNWITGCPERGSSYPVEDQAWICPPCRVNGHTEGFRKGSCRSP